MAKEIKIWNRPRWNLVLCVSQGSYAFSLQESPFSTPILKSESVYFFKKIYLMILFLKSFLFLFFFNDKKSLVLFYIYLKHFLFSFLTGPFSKCRFTFVLCLELHSLYGHFSHLNYAGVSLFTIHVYKQISYPLLSLATCLPPYLPSHSHF